MRLSKKNSEHLISNGKPPTSPKKNQLNKLSFLSSATSSTENCETLIKPKSRWSSVRDKNNLNKIRIQRFHEELKNANNFMNTNELIFEKYKYSKGTNFFNLFGASQTQKIRPSNNILMTFTKSVIAQKFTTVLKQKLLAHTLNEKQIKFLNDYSYSKMTEFAKRRQNIQKKFSQNSIGSDGDSLSKAKEKIIDFLTYYFEILFKTRVFSYFKNIFKKSFKVQMPDGTYRICVDMVCLTFIVYEIIEIPLMLSFTEIQNDNLDNFSTFITFFFISDMIMSFNTGFYKRGNIVKNRKEIAKNYLSTWFLLDAFSSFPYDLLINSLTNMNSDNIDNLNTVQQNSKLLKIFRFIKFLKILRLLRVVKVRKIFAKIEDYMQLSPAFNAVLAFIRLCFLIICIAHWFACIWHLLAVYEDADYPITWLKQADLTNADWTERYVTSLYWAITTMITVGYGDITPLTSPEKLYTISCMLLACGVFGYTMNRIGNIFQSFEETSMEFKLKMFQINQYMKSKNVPKEMQARIRKYIQFTLDPEKRSQLDESSFFKCLSKNLKGEIIVHINGNIINQYEFFSDFTSQRLLSKLPFYLNEQIYGPEEMIVSESDIPRDSNIYFLKQGVARAYIKASDTDIFEIQSGLTFGQVGFFSDVKWSYSIQSLDFTSLFYLKRADFLKVIEEEKLRDDLESFQQVKDKIEIYNDFSILRLNCTSCSDEYHLINECPTLHYVINVEELIKDLAKSEGNFRIHFRRNDKRKKFHSTNDITLIQSSALALRDILFIIKEEGIKENYRIDINVDDFLDENPEGFPLEKKISHLNNSNIMKSQEIKYSMIDNEDLYDYENEKKKIFSKSSSYYCLNDTIVESFQIDKIENFSIYFTHNNFNEIIKETNYFVEKKLEHFHKPNNSTVESPENLKNMIKITKSKTIKKRKDTFLEKRKKNAEAKKKENIKENEKNDKESEKIVSKHKIRFSIFGANKREEKEKEMAYKLKPEIRITKGDQIFKEEIPLLHPPPKECFESIKSDENNDGSPKASKVQKLQKPIEKRKERKSISCDGTHTIEKLLKKTSLRQLEEIIKIRKENE